MSVEPRLKLVLCWHMHQPHYRDLISGEHQLPWSYLHAIKDYVDMAAHLEAEPRAKAVINFTPTLLEQIEEYSRQVRGFLHDTQAIRDPILAALAQPVISTDPHQRVTLARACLRVNEKRLIDRFPPYRRLADMMTWLHQHPEGIAYLSDQFLVDIVVWYHLAWLGETVRRTDPRAQRLIARGTGYSLHDRRELLTLIGELLDTVIDRYKVLAKNEQIELSYTPYAHPILPLLLDLNSVKEAMPAAQMPLLASYPGGEARARWHITHGLRVFEHYFGIRPRGCWPAEGSVSTATLKLLDEYGFDWVASGETVMHNSLRLPLNHLAKNVRPSLGVHRPYTLKNTRTSCFFRDDGLSDLIGFTYSNWHADDAISNLIHHLENIAGTYAGKPPPIVSIILDGENAWEYYPDNGYYFLSALYARLAAHPRIELTTFSACLDQAAPAVELTALCAGSWVYGTFSTWIGSADKNRGWDMLGDAKRAYDAVIAGGQLSAEQRACVDKQLALCEGSDWFWWFGDYNPAATVSDFERLFRLHLANLYQMLGVAPPEYLSHVMSQGSGDPSMGGVMRPGQEKNL